MSRSATPLRIVLASASPRRRELLSELAIDFIVRPVSADETPITGETPDQLVRRLALAKARAAARIGEIAIGADTVVALDGEILGKPRDDAEARRMLERLAGREHDVWTGVAVVAAPAGESRREATSVERSGVRFRSLAADEIATYVATGEPSDKAGAYAVQGGAAAFVTELRGSWSNVVGLPWVASARLIAEMVGDGSLLRTAATAEAKAIERWASAISRRL